MSTIGDRLKNERKRLGYSQENFAAVAGVTRRPYAEWESGNTSPTAMQLALIGAAGADVFYIVMGDRDAPPPLALSAEEQLLLDRYRNSPQALKDAALRVLLGGEAGSSKIHIGGKVQGQVVEGGLVQNGPINIGSKNKIKK